MIRIIFIHVLFFNLISLEVICQEKSLELIAEIENKINDIGAIVSYLNSNENSENRRLFFAEDEIVSDSNSSLIMSKERLNNLIIGVQDSIYNLNNDKFSTISKSYIKSVFELLKEDSYIENGNYIVIDVVNNYFQNHQLFLVSLQAIKIDNSLYSMAEAKERIDHVKCLSLKIDSILVVFDTAGVSLNDESITKIDSLHNITRHSIQKEIKVNRKLIVFSFLLSFITIIATIATQ